jgi:hypothetical protein
VDANYDNELSFGVALEQKLFDAAAIARYIQAKKGRAVQGILADYTMHMIVTAAKKLYAQVHLSRRSWM